MNTDIFAESAKYFATPLQLFQYYDKYSRFNYELGRRETWLETVDRTVDYLQKLSKNSLPQEDYDKIRQFILEMKVIPSMRLLAMAGPAADRNNITLYNCSFFGVDSIDAFAEAMLISMNGCGVGYSVEKRYINRLPNLPERLVETRKTFIVPDTTEGWVEAVRTHLDHLYAGEIINFDYSELRPAGAVLKTKGGRASGPDPLMNALDFITGVFMSYYLDFQDWYSESNYFYSKPVTNKLESVHIHDIMCAIGQCSISGGTRRTAMISLFDKDDNLMLYSKQGSYPPIRWNANNSMVWPLEGISEVEFISQMSSMFSGKNGEPGIFSLKNAQDWAPTRRNSKLIAGTNPCGEILLRDKQFCNLSAVIARPEDTLETLIEKVEVAAVIGTIQSMATYFPGLRPEWQANCEEERLLGVDINGQMDCPVLMGSKDGQIFDHLREVAISTNIKYANILGINRSTAVTCVKPSGNSSQLVDCSSGIHPRYAPYYIRNVRVNVYTPIFKMLQDQGIPMVPDNGYSWETTDKAVIPFPVKAPEGAVTRSEVTAIDQCEFWKVNKVHYTEHNPSVTINYREGEEMKLMNWIWQNKDVIGGMAFLPYDNALYENMPYQEISKEEYETRLSEFPEIDWSQLSNYENEDYTTAAQEIACSSGMCELQL